MKRLLIVLVLCSLLITTVSATTCVFLNITQGPQGVQGIQGIPGIQGEQGEPGINGLDNMTAGPQGVPGDKGDTGAKGDKGDTGSKGDQGDQGIQGIQGNQGIPGLENMTAGPAGADGEDGAPGAKGDKGDQGDAGVKGDQGVPGEQGIPGLMNQTINMTAGPKGDTGEKGNTGDQGIQGIQGIQGVPGATIGYTLYVTHLTSSPADSVANYWGMNPLAVTTTKSIRKVPIPKSGTIKEVHVAQNSGTAGTAEAYSLYVDVNGVVNNSNLVQTQSVAASIRLFDNTTMALAVTKGDYIEMRFANPAWATNPLTTFSNGYLYVE